MQRTFRVAAVVFAVTLLLSSAALSGQATPPAPPANDNPDAQVVEAQAAPKTPAELTQAAWLMLTNAVTTSKDSNLQAQGLAACGLLGDSPRSIKLITDAMQAKDLDIRSSAALAASETKAASLTTPLRLLLDDKEPPVAFAAAISLWKLKDQSGEDILLAVADGQRATASGRLSSVQHDMGKDLRHPAGIAKFAAMQGAGMLLGPFGYGITAYEYLRKNGGDLARVTAIELLAQNHTTPIRDELVSALVDKDPGVRLASAKALRFYHEAPVSAAIGKVFDDGNAPVRLTAAAAYLISVGAAPGVPEPGQTITPPRRRQR